MNSQNSLSGCVATQMQGCCFVTPCQHLVQCCGSGFIEQYNWCWGPEVHTVRITAVSLQMIFSSIPCTDFSLAAGVLLPIQFKVMQPILCSPLSEPNLSEEGWITRLIILGEHSWCEQKHCCRHTL